MCGIVGILGSEPVAPCMVDALKRLEYRGYDSAGVATLEQGHLTRRRAEGKLREPGARLATRAARGHHRHRPHPLGDPRPAQREQRPSARDRPRRGGSQRHHREFPRAARGAERQRRQVRHRDRHRGGRASRHRRDEEGPPAGRRGRGRAAAAQGRVRARLPVRRRGGSAGRRPPRLAARDRLRRRRDVSRLRRDRARAVHQRDQLPRGRRHGSCSPASGAEVHDAAGKRGDARRCIRSAPRRSWSTRATTATSWRRRSTSSPRWSATRSPITSTCRRARIALPAELPFDFATIERVSISACGTAYYAGLVAKYWFERFARLPVEIDVASEFRYREAPFEPGNLALFVSQSGETADTLATLRYAKRAEAARRCRSSTCRPRPSRARATS